MEICIANKASLNSLKIKEHRKELSASLVLLNLKSMILKITIPIMTTPIMK